MIRPKQTRPTAREEAEAYELCTLRDQDVCQRCRRGEPVNRHHRKGRGVGGLTVVENLTLLCGSGTTGCHGYVTAHPAEAIREGWAVPGWADPAAYPARRWVKTTVGTVRAVWVLYLPRDRWPEAWRLEDTFRVIGDDEAAARIAGLLKEVA